MKRSPRVAALSLITAAIAGPVLALTLSMGTAQAIELGLETDIGLNSAAYVDGSANANANANGRIDLASIDADVSLLEANVDVDVEADGEAADVNALIAELSG